MSIAITHYYKEIINFILQNTYIHIKILSVLLNHVLQNKSITLYPPYKNFVPENSISQGLVKRIKLKEENKQASTSPL